MRFCVTYSFAAVLLGAVSVTARPLPLDSLHSLQKRAELGIVLRLGLVNEENPVQIKLASNSTRESSDFSFRIGNLHSVTYKDGKDNVPLPLPVMDIGRQADMDHYYLSLGLGLPPYFRRLAENTRKRHFKSLLDREKLETSMHRDILGKLAEINFEFTEYEARSCVFAALSYFVSEGLLSLENVIGMIDHIVKIMETLKLSVPLLPSTSAALPKVPNESLLQHVDVDEPWSPPKSSAALLNKFASNDPVQHGGGSLQPKHPASTSTALRHLLGPPNPLNPANLAHILNP